MFTKKIALSAALVLALCGTVMANDSGENHQDDGGNKVVQSQVVNHHVKN
jgi:hypothetical protein